MATSRKKGRGLSLDAAEFLDKVVQKGGDPLEAVEQPKQVAKELGLSLTAKALRGLKAVRGLPEKMDPADREVLSFFNKVVVDGRFVHEFTVQPANVARK